MPPDPELEYFGGSKQPWLSACIWEKPNEQDRFQQDRQKAEPSKRGCFFLGLAKGLLRQVLCTGHPYIGGKDTAG